MTPVHLPALGSKPLHRVTALCEEIRAVRKGKTAIQCYIVMK